MTTPDDASKPVADALPLPRPGPIAGSGPQPAPVAPPPTFPKPQPGQGDPGTPGNGNIGTGPVGIPSDLAQSIVQAIQAAADAISAGAANGQDSGWLQIAVDNLLAMGNAEFDNPFTSSKPPPNWALRCTQALHASQSTLMAAIKQIDAALKTATPAEKPALEAQRAEYVADLAHAAENCAQCMKSALQAKS